jgi:hypothetical protein
MTEILLYKTANQEVKLEVFIEDETIWLNQKQLCELFGKDKSVISRHIKNIFRENELDINSVVAKNATTATDGKKYIVDYYNLDMIISVGYRVNSTQATQFRIWATKILQEYYPIKAQLAKELAESEFEKYKEIQDGAYLSDFDTLILKLEKK